MAWFSSKTTHETDLPTSRSKVVFAAKLYHVYKTVVKTVPEHSITVIRRNVPAHVLLDISNAFDSFSFTRTLRYHYQVNVPANIMLHNSLLFNSQAAQLVSFAILSLRVRFPQAATKSRGERSAKDPVGVN